MFEAPRGLHIRTGQTFPWGSVSAPRPVLSSPHTVSRIQIASKVLAIYGGVDVCEPPVPGFPLNLSPKALRLAMSSAVSKGFSRSFRKYTFRARSALLMLRMLTFIRTDFLKIAAVT